MANPSQPKKPAAPPATAFDPWLLWVALRRHWTWVISAGVCLALLGSTVVYVTFEPEFEATCILQANHDFVLSKDAIESTKDLARNERLIILSPVVIGDVLSDPELKSAPSLSDPDTREYEMRRRLKISNGGTDDLLLISYRDSNAVQAAKVANAVADEYIKERRIYDDQRFKNVVSSLRLPIEQLERKVKEGRATVTRLSKQTTGIDPFKNSGDSSRQGNYLEELQKQYSGIEFDLSTLNDRLEIRQERLGQESPSKMSIEREIRTYIEEDSEVKLVKARITFNEETKREIARKEQQGVFAANYFASRYADLKKEHDALQRDLKTAENDARSRAVVALREENARSQQEVIEDLQIQIQTLEAKRKKVNEEIEKETERLETFSGETTELYFAKNELDEDSEALLQARNRRVAMELEQGRGPGVTTRSPAREPNAPLEETPIKKILLAAAVAFISPFLIAVFIEFRAKRITSAESIDASQLIPILGEIAKISPGRKLSSSSRVFEESVDAMRANLLFKMEEVRSIATTSAMSGEGKSSIAYQLANSIARCSGERVLVIDADVRNPDQHVFLGVEQGPGLCKLLAGKCEFEECIAECENDGVHLLSAGRLDSNPHNLLSRKNFRAILEKATATYRYVVVDTAPVLPAAETLHITAECDATLLCAMRDVSQAEHVKRTFTRLQESGANVIGAVFSGVPARIYASKYGDYRYVDSTPP